MLSQCDNLLLMRMNSEADLGHLSDAFSFVPDSLIQRATTFRQGETVAGKVVSHPTYVRFGQRFSQEGGADIPTSWASRAVTVRSMRSKSPRTTDIAAATLLGAFAAPGL